MTTDLSEFTSSRRSPEKCKVGRVLDDLQDNSERHKKLVTALSLKDGNNRYKIESESISRVLKTWGFPVSGKTIALHRLAGCCCLQSQKTER